MKPSILSGSWKARRGLSSWWLGFILALIVAVLLVRWLLRPAEEKPIPLSEGELIKPARKPKVVKKEDDLTRITGIGPKIHSLLKAQGIFTFNQLAAADPGDLGRLLRAARIYTADASTWPGQARLAAAGEWETLEALQFEIRRGRRAG